MAFLGSGIDVIYPPENLELYNKTGNQGDFFQNFHLEEEQTVELFL